MELGDFPSLNASYLESSKRLTSIQAQIRERVSGPHDHICVFAVGSYGRKEAHVASDFEWMTIYDDSLVGTAEAWAFQAQVTGFFAEVFGRKNLSINKTFGEVASISDICTNVGGEADTNRAMTYRMLALCEGAHTNGSGAYDTLLHRMALTYGGSHTAGHRLLSLATEIARYWRTLRIDYKHKVDERKRPWAVRSLKLRSARRFGYLSSMMDFVAFGPRIRYEESRTFEVRKVESFMKRMSGNPATRLAAAIEKMGGDMAATKDLVATYDDVHRRLGDPEIRADLDALEENARWGNSNFVAIREGCVQMHRKAAALVQQVPQSYRQEIVEMFLL
jgi:hypothetical protein